MIDRTERLATEMVRQAALNLPDKTFLGWRDFLHKLNRFVNEFVRKQPEDPLEFVTIHGEPQEGSAILDVYSGDSERHGFSPEKLLNGVRYFLGEMGINIEAIQQKPGEPDSQLVTVSGISKYEEPEHHKTLKNQWMRRALQSGDAIDVEQIGVEVEPGVFRLTEFTPGIQYVVAKDETFIYSIGKDNESGEFLAAEDDRFYQNPDYECVYLI